MIHRYQFISEHHASYGVAAVPVLAVPRRQGYYEWLAAQPARAQRAEAEDQLAAEIRAVHGAHRGACGEPSLVQRATPAELRGRDSVRAALSPRVGFRSAPLSVTHSSCGSARQRRSQSSG